MIQMRGWQIAHCCQPLAQACSPATMMTTSPDACLTLQMQNACSTVELAACHMQQGRCRTLTCVCFRVLACDASC